MKSTEIPIDPNFEYANGQSIKYQRVKTPFGDIVISCNVKTPRLSASRRTWNLWFRRFVNVRLDDNCSHLTFINRLNFQKTIDSWKKGQ